MAAGMRADLDGGAGDVVLAPLELEDGGRAVPGDPPPRRALGVVAGAARREDAHHPPDARVLHLW